MKAKGQLEQLIFVRNGRGAYGFTGFDPMLNAEKVYIGRAMQGIPASPLGNPERVSVHTVEAHNRAVDGFDHHIAAEIQKGKAGIPSAALDEISRLADKVLAGKSIVLTCWCDPLPCHGHSVKREVVDRALEIQQEQSQIGASPVLGDQSLAPAFPEQVTQLQPHQVFVFGSNTEGRHGKGAALVASRFGAEYGNSKGRQAQSRTDLKIISGGQTGADLGGLIGAAKVGIPTGGVAPHGWLVERDVRFPNGTNSKLAELGLVEGPRGNNTGHTYMLRTKMNVKNSDGTVVFGSADPSRDKGSARTNGSAARDVFELADQHRKPWIHFELDELNNPQQCAKELREWVVANRIETLNVAGNRGSKAPRLETQTAQVIESAFREPIQQQSNEKVVNYLCRIDPEVVFSPREQAIARMETAKIVEGAIKTAAQKGYDRAVFRVSTLEGNNGLLREAIEQAQERQRDGKLGLIEVTLTTDRVTGKSGKDDTFIAITTGRDERTRQAIDVSRRAGVQVVGFDVARNVTLKMNTVPMLKGMQNER